MVLKRMTIKFTLSTLLVLMIVGVSFSQVYVEIYDPYGGSGSKPLPDDISIKIIECFGGTGSGASGMTTIGLPWGTKIIDYKANSSCAILPNGILANEYTNVWQRISNGEPDYYSRGWYQNGWDISLGGGPSLGNDYYIFFDLDQLYLLPPTDVPCCTDSIDSTQYHFGGYDAHLLNMNVFVKPGTYTLKAGFSNSETICYGDPQYAFDHISGDEAEFYVVERENFVFEADVFFDKTKSGWNDWLPTAPLEEGDEPGLFPIHVGLTGQGGPYKLRVNLRNITCYPGGWTNDYNDVPKEVPDNNRLNPDEWYESLSYRGCNVEEFCDFKIEEKYNEDNGWNFKFITYVDVEPGGYGSDFPGWYEAEYTKEVTPGDKIPPLILSSYDFGASCYMSAGLAKWTEGSFPDFYPATLFEQRVDGEDIEFNLLPIPRDMEMTWYEWPNSIAKLIDRDKFLLGLGDRLGDAWEEQYVRAVESPAIPEKIYTSIYQCMPYVDDTAEYDDFFPNNVIDAAKQAGDGFLNLEKYRGFHGIEHTFLDRQGADSAGIAHKRLSPAYRNIFAMLETDEDLLDAPITVFDTTYVWHADTTAPDSSDADSILVPIVTSHTLNTLHEYLNQDTLGSFYDIGKGRMYIHQLAKNTITEKYYYPQPQSRFINFVSNNSLGEKTQKDFANGSYYLNTRCGQLKNQQKLVSLWCYNYYKFDKTPFNTFAKKYNIWNRDNPCDIPLMPDSIETKSGYTGTFGRKINGVLYNTPLDVYFCHVYSNVLISEACSKAHLYSEEIDPFAVTLIKKTVSHELGHFVGMQDNEDDNYSNFSIMTQTGYLFLGPFLIPEQFKAIDYKSFRLSE
jgi:hypothetical protein